MIRSCSGSSVPAAPPAAESARLPAARSKSFIDDILSITAIDNNSHYHECAEMMSFKIIDLTPNRKRINLALSRDAEKRYRGFCNFSFELNESSISLLSAKKTDNIPWNSSDLFQHAFDLLTKHTDSSIAINRFKVIGISSYEDKSLATNLESVRKRENSSVIDIERELFINNSFGRAVLRMLNRINYRPKLDTLMWSNSEVSSEANFGRSEDIKPTDTDLLFDVVII